MVVLTPLFVAFSFLTIIPLSIKSGLREKDLATSMGYFPLVGLFIGGILTGINIFGGKIFPPYLTDLFIVLALTIITGGLHLDGLADTVDGLAGGDTKEKTLSIMKDSHTGPMGVLAIVFAILFKYMAILSMSASMKDKALLIMPVVSRWSMVAMAYFAPYARHEGGTGMVFVKNVSWTSLILASGFVIILTLIIGGWKTGGIVLFTVSVVTLLCILYFIKRLGGVTGDILGAVNEVNEVMVLLILCAMKGVRDCFALGLHV